MSEPTRIRPPPCLAKTHIAFVVNGETEARSHPPKTLLEVCARTSPDGHPDGCELGSAHLRGARGRRPFSPAGPVRRVKAQRRDRRGHAGPRGCIRLQKPLPIRAAHCGYARRDSSTQGSPRANPKPTLPQISAGRCRKSLPVHRLIKILLPVELAAVDAGETRSPSQSLFVFDFDESGLLQL